MVTAADIFKAQQVMGHYTVKGMSFEEAARYQADDPNAPELPLSTEEVVIPQIEKDQAEQLLGLIVQVAQEVDEDRQQQAARLESIDGTLSEFRLRMQHESEARTAAEKKRAAKEKAQSRTQAKNTRKVTELEKAVKVLTAKLATLVVPDVERPAASDPTRQFARSFVSMT